MWESRGTEEVKRATPFEQKKGKKKNKPAKKDKSESKSEAEDGNK